MDQINVSMTDHLASYVREKVKSGRYSNASEVVRDAVRRMEEQEARQLLLTRLAGEERECHTAAGSEAAGSGQGW